MRVMAWQRERLIDLAQMGLPVCKAAEEVSLSYWMGLKLCHKARVRVRRGRRRGSKYPVTDPIRKARALAMIAEGEKLRDAAAAVGVSHECVRQWAAQEDVPLLRARKPRSGAPGNAWASSSKAASKPEKASKTPPIDPRIIVARNGVSLARRA